MTSFTEWLCWGAGLWGRLRLGRLPLLLLIVVEEIKMWLVRAGLRVCARGHLTRWWRIPHYRVVLL